MIKVQNNKHEHLSRRGIVSILGSIRQISGNSCESILNFTFFTASHDLNNATRPPAFCKCSATHTIKANAIFLIQTLAIARFPFVGKARCDFCIRPRLNCTVDERNFRCR